MIHRLLLAAAAAVLSLGLVGCPSPASVLAPTGGAGKVTLSFHTGSRSVSADWSTLVHSYSATLTSQDGFAPVSGSVTGSASLALSGVAQGTWDIAAQAFDIDGNVVLQGNLTSVVLPTGSAVTLNLLPQASATGSFSFALRFPASFGIDQIAATLYKPDGTVAASLPNVTSFAAVTGGLNEAVIAKTGVASGLYRLQLTLSKAGIAYRYLNEAVNLWDSVVSNTWVAPDGTLAAYRTLTLADFKDDNTTLDALDLTVDGVAFPFGFTPGTSTYSPSISSKTLTQAVVFTPRKAIPGSSLAYSTDSGTVWTAWATDLPVPVINLGAGPLDFRVRVTAATGQTRVYQVTVNKTVLPALEGFWKVTNPDASLTTQPPALVEGTPGAGGLYLTASYPNADQQVVYGPYRLRALITGAGTSFSWTPDSIWNFVKAQWDLFTPVPQTPTYDFDASDPQNVIVSAGGQHQFDLVPWTTYQPLASIGVTSDATHVAASPVYAGSPSDVVPALVLTSNKPDILAVDTYTGVYTFGSGNGSATIRVSSVADPTIFVDLAVSHSGISVLAPPSAPTITVAAPSNLVFSLSGGPAMSAYLYQATASLPMTSWKWYLDGNPPVVTGVGTTTSFNLDASTLALGPHTLRVEGTAAGGLVYSNSPSTNALDFTVAQQVAPSNVIGLADNRGRFTMVAPDASGGGWLAMGTMGNANLPFVARILTSHVVDSSWGSYGYWMPNDLNGMGGRYFGDSLGFVQLADKSLLMTEYFQNGVGNTWVWKSTPSGATDVTWGGGTGVYAGGVVNTNGPSQVASARPVVDSAGNLYVVNWLNSPYYQIKKTLADGTRDDAYNGATPAFGAMVHRLAIQSDDKVVAVINGTPGSLARLNTDGTLDAGFGSMGFANLPAPYNSGAVMTSVVVAPSGLIYVTAWVAGTGIVARFDASGALDTTFNPAGASPGFFTLGGREPLDLALAPNGTVVVVGTTIFAEYVYDFESTSTQAFVTRFAPNATLVVPDPTFQNSGFAERNDPLGSSAQGVAIDGAGRIAVAGFTKNDSVVPSPNVTPAVWFY